MKGGQIRAIHHWQAMFEDKTTAPSSVFQVLPKKFLEECRKSGVSSKFQFKKCTSLIKSSEWRDELSLIFICFVIDTRFIEKSETYNLIKSCANYLAECSRIAGGKDQVRHDYHLKPRYAREYLEIFRTKHATRLNDQLILAIEVVEGVLGNLPKRESQALSHFQLGMTSEELYDDLRPNTLETLRSLLPQDLQFLRATIFDPDYKGQAPNRLLLRFLCQQLTIAEFSWSVHLILYAAISLSKDKSQPSIIEKLNDTYRFLFFLDTVNYREDSAFDIRTRVIPKYQNEITRTLASHPDLRDYVVSWRAVISLGLKIPSAHQKKDWKDIINQTLYKKYLQFFIIDQFIFSSSDELQNKLTTYLWKWKNSPYFSQLVLLAIGLVSNQEHRPASAMHIVRGLRLLLERVAEEEMGTLNAKAILKVLESSAPDDPQGTARLMLLATAYRGAWQSQQTFLLRQQGPAEMPSDLLLPELPRSIVFSRQENSARVLRQERRQSAIDRVAESWDELHRWADYQLVALRAVMLAFHEVTWNQDPRYAPAPQPLDVAISGHGETWHFTIWTGKLFHSHAFRQQTESNIPEEHFFLEYRGVSGVAEPQGLWCADLFRTWFCMEAARRFEATWGRSTEWLRSVDPGVLNLGRSLSQVLRPSVKALQAQGHPVPCIFRPESVYRAALFGALAMRLSREGAHRGHESLQLRNDQDYLFLHTHRDQETIFMKLLPKGHKGTRSRPETPAYKVVSVAALRCLEALQHHRWLTGEESSASRMGKAGQYAFQVNQRVISLQSLNVCLRFLTYGFGMTSQAEPDRVLNLTSHLLRYGFAINARQKGIHLDDLALALNHKNVLTSAYYGRPTSLQQRNTLARVARQVSGQSMSEMSPDLPEVLLDDFWPLASHGEASSFEQWLQEIEQDLERREMALIQQMRGLS
ncbi:integrase [Deinococcus gobiensis]|nr:integrase [Deinococcus gobiensis]